MFSIFVYIVPAVLARFLYLQQPMGRWGAGVFSVGLFVVVFPVTLILNRGNALPGSSFGLVIIASIWSYFILRTKAGVGGEEDDSSRDSKSANPIDTPPSKPNPSPSPVTKRGQITPDTSAQTSATITTVEEKIAKQTDTTQDKQATPPSPRPQNVQEADAAPAKTHKKMQDDEHIYEQVAAELKGGNRKEGLWLKAQTQAEGNADKTQALYVKWRVEQLAEEEEQRRQELSRLASFVEEEKLQTEENERLKEGEACIEPLCQYGYSVEWTTQVRNVGKIPAWRVQKPDGESVWFYSIDSLASFVEEKEAEQPDNLYYGREGVEQNFKEAAKLYRMAAEQGDAHSQVSLGFMYANGEGVEQSYKEAIKWYRKAAEQGDEDAIVALEELPQ